MKWQVYILQCSDQSLYTGITTDIRRRLKEHNAKKGAKAIKGKLPVRLVYQENHSSRSKAQVREAEIKSWSRTQKLVFLKKSLILKG